jgi:hypothetical protein
VWWHTPGIPALGRLRQEDHEFNASLRCIETPCHKQDKKKEEGRETNKIFEKRKAFPFCSNSDTRGHLIFSECSASYPIFRNHFEMAPRTEDGGFQMSFGQD